VTLTGFCANAERHRRHRLGSVRQPGKVWASLLLAARDVARLRSLCTRLPDNGSGGHA